MSDASTGDALVGFVDYESMIARLASRYPRLSRDHIERVARAEYEAVTGGQIFVVPMVVEEGVRETLDARTRVVERSGRDEDAAAG